MKKLFAVSFLSLCLIFSSAPAASAATIEELQAQIQSLLQQLSALQGQTSSSTANVQSGTQTTTFSRDLSIGLKNDADVTALQNILNQNGYLTADNITGNYGSVTAAAVRAFQSSRGINPTGYVGPLTRGALSGASFNVSNNSAASQLGGPTVGKPLVNPIPVGTPVATSVPTVDLKVNGSDSPINITSSTVVNLTWQAQPSNSSTMSCSVPSDTVLPDWNGGLPLSGLKTVNAITDWNSIKPDTYSMTYWISCTDSSTGKTAIDHVVVITPPATSQTQAVTLAFQNSSGTLPEATVGQSYSSDIPFTYGGNSTVSVGGFKPAGLNFQVTTNSAGQKVVRISGTPTVSISGDLGLYLQASGSVNVTGSFYLKINSAIGVISQTPTVNFTANPTSVTSGQPTTLTWGSVNATSCVLTNSVQPLKYGDVSLSGTLTTYGTGNFLFTCYNSTGQSASANVNVNVVSDTISAATPAKPTLTTSTNYACGGNTNLSWTSVAGASSYKVYRNGGFVTSTQSLSWYDTNLTPSASYSYQVLPTNGTDNAASYSNMSTVTASPACNVQPVANPISAPTPSSVTLTASPTSFPTSAGGITTLTWSASNASSCSFTNLYTSYGSATSGSLPTSVSQTTTYTMNCTGSNGPSTAGVTVNVPIPAAAAAPSVTMAAVPTTVDPNNIANNLSTLHIDVASVQSCEVSGNGSVLSNGARYTYAPGSYLPVHPNVPTTYSVICWDKYGQTVSSSASVSILGQQQSNVLIGIQDLLNQIRIQIGNLR